MRATLAPLPVRRDRVNIEGAYQLTLPRGKTMKTRNWAVVVTLVIVSFSVMAQNAPQPATQPATQPGGRRGGGRGGANAATVVVPPGKPTVILWPNGAPGSEARKDEPERIQGETIVNVHNPSI